MPFGNGKLCGAAHKIVGDKNATKIDETHRIFEQFVSHSRDHICLSQNQVILEIVFHLSLVV